jgi:YVTN family beta-propeller protein
MAELPRGTVTFLFTDVEGSTRLLKQIGEGYGDVIAAHQSLLRSAFGRHGGHEIDTQGDSFFVAFQRALDAVAAAVDAQRLLANHAWPLGVELRVRMGLHTAEPSVRPERYVGLGVHRAARIMAAGHGGQILLSNTTRELIQDDLPGDVRLRELGEHRLKDLDRPERLFQLVVEGLPSQFPLLRTQDAPTAYTGLEDELAMAAGAAIERPPLLRRRSVALAMLAGVVVAAVSVPILALDGGGSPTSNEALVTANSAVAIDAVTREPVASVPVGSGPLRSAVGEGAVWVLNGNDGTVSRLDPSKNVVVQTISTGAGPAGITVGGGAVWVTNGTEGTVSRIDAETNILIQTIPLPRGPRGVAFGAGSVWVANLDDRSVSRIDAVSGDVLQTISTAGTPTAIAVERGSVWVTNESNASVSRISPKNDSIVQTVNVGNGPSAIATGFGAVWVANTLDATVSRIDPSTGSVTTTVSVGEGPRDVAVGLGAVWVASEFAGTVSAIDPQSGSVRTTALEGTRPTGLAIDDGTVWVTLRPGAGAHQGGTLRVAGLAVAIDSIDPALAYDPTSWQILSAAGDGLTAFKRVGGPEGATVVPDLALSLPIPTDRGRVYTFTLRRGIRYSSGALVQPRDVRRSIERLFELGSPGASFYATIAGAGACMKGRRCDLSRGIVVDPKAMTIAFRLVRPDAELPIKLALPFAFVVPAETPSREATRPLPATGPYVVTGSDPKRGVELVRNPHFRVWSAAARPAGYPDKIVITLMRPDDGLAAIERSRADLAFPVPAERMDEIAVRYPGQLRSTPGGEVDFVALNTMVPPFDNVDARRALSYALDRDAVVELFGGPELAQPSCQVLPPNFPGYEPYCPYTRGSSRTSQWSAPDLERARRLVARSGTRGMRVVVVTADIPPYDRFARLVASTLDRLGYEASSKVLSYERWAGAFSNSQSRSSAAIGAWRADYPSPAGYLVPLFSCTGESIMRFCRPAIDTLIRRAQALQTSDPRASNAVWARIDRAVVDEAPLVTTHVLKTSQLSSKRVGNYQFHPLYTALLDQLWVR